VTKTQIATRWPALAAAWRDDDPAARRSRWIWAVDAFIAVLLAAGSLADALDHDQHANTLDGPYSPIPHHVRLHGGGSLLPAFDAYPPAQWWQLLLAVGTALPLVFRRQRPLTVFWAVLGLSFVYHLSAGFDPTYTLAACVVAAFGATMYSPHRTASWISAGIGAVVIVVYHKTDLPYSTPGLVMILLLIPAGLLVNSLHTWKQRTADLRSEQEAATRQAVDKERSRMARELHDVVTHNVSVMTAQAGAARTVLDLSPEQAREAMQAVESAGRAALGELRQVMGLLTMGGADDDEPNPDARLTPQPGLDQVATLAERIRRTGVQVELAVTGTATPLPAGRDLAAYRVVQEALTNAVKHAPGASVRITVDYGADAVRIEVTDSGGTRARSGLAADGSGSGLIGLRERLTMYGGTLQAGRRADSGFAVSAVIPLVRLEAM